MAARLRKTHQDDVRKKIQASQLINVLQDHALGKADLPQSRIKAIEILLRKTIPDLSQMQLSGDEDNPVQTVHRIELVPLNGDGKN